MIGPSYIDEDLAVFQRALDRFIERECLPHVAAWERDGYVPQEVWRKAGEAGLLMASADADYGGGGGHFGHEALICERLMHYGAHGFAIPVQNTVFGPYITHFASQAQKQAWIPKLATGELIGAIAMTEPGAGSDLASIRTTARRDGDSYVINGQKIFTTLGHMANIIMVACRTDAPERSGGISLLMVEKDRVTGFSVGRKLDKIGLNAHGTAELFFEDVRVPVENLLGGQEGQGFKQMMVNLAQERLMTAIEAIAMIERALEDTISYVKDRRAFGQAVIDFQNTRFTLADCKTEATVGRLFVNHCVERHIRGELDAETAAMAKLWLSETQGRIIDRCLQLHGGYGYINEYPIARMYRDARVSRIYGGTSEIMRLIIGRGL